MLRRRRFSASLLFEWLCALPNAWINLALPDWQLPNRQFRMRVACVCRLALFALANTLITLLQAIQRFIFRNGGNFVVPNTTMFRQSMARSSKIRLFLTAAFFAVIISAGISFLEFCSVWPIWWFWSVSGADAPTQPPLSVSSTEDSFINAIEGFGTDLQCFINTCPPPGKTVSCFFLYMITFMKYFFQVKWWQNGKQITDGIKLLTNNTRMSIRHNVALDHTKGALIFLVHFITHYRIFWF